MNLWKIVLLPTAIALYCCGDDDSFNCKDIGDSGNFGKQVSAGTYYASTDVNAKEVLELRDDSTFTFHGIDSLGDTLISEKGVFSIHKTPKSDLTGDKEVYSLVMSSQNADSILIDVQASDSCFTLAIEDYDGDFCKGTRHYTKSRTFCANVNPNK